MSLIRNREEKSTVQCETGATNDVLAWENSIFKPYKIQFYAVDFPNPLLINQTQQLWFGTYNKEAPVVSEEATIYKCIQQNNTQFNVAY